jgi:hypothetical protein
VAILLAALLLLWILLALPGCGSGSSGLGHL